MYFRYFSPGENKRRLIYNDLAKINVFLKVTMMKKRNLMYNEYWIQAD